MKKKIKYNQSDEEILEDNRLQQEMHRELFNEKEYLVKRFSRLDRLLGRKYSGEIKKGMINFLVEDL